MIKRARSRPGAFLVGGGLVAALLATIVVLVVVLTAPFNSANRATAVGDVFGGGIFMLAAIAAVPAVIAYVQSFRHPTVTIDWSFREQRHGTLLDKHFPQFPRDPGIRNYTGPQFIGVDTTTLIPLEPVMLKGEMANGGDGDSKFVTLVFALKGIYFDRTPNLPDGAHWKFFPHEWGWQVQYEGAAIASPLYPGFRKGSEVTLTGMWALPDIAYSDADDDGEGFSVYADYLRAPQSQTLKATAAPLPVAAGPVAR